MFIPVHRVLKAWLAFAAFATTPILAQQTTTVVLVRHGEKAAAPADDPPLTDAGRARAESLSVSLAALAPAAILITPTARTRQTATPLAARFGLTPVIVYNAGALAERADSVAALIRRAYVGKALVVVGHSNTVPGIIKALGGPAMADLCDSEYDSMFVLQLLAGGAVRMVRATYGVADNASGAGCAAMKGGRL